LSSTVLGSIVGLFAGFFTYRYISPELLGIWALFSVFEGYATFTRIGVINGLGRELPFLLGQNKTTEANSYASTALFYTLCSNVILLGLLPIIIIDNKAVLQDSYYLLSLIVVVIRLLLSSYTSYLSVTFRTSKSFNDLSDIQYYLIVLKLVSLLLVVYFGFLGLLIRNGLTAMVELILFHWKRPIKVLPKFKKTDFLSLIKVGFPLFAVSYASGFIDTIPRLYIINFGTIEQLGLFSPILVVLSLGLLLPQAIGSYMYPKMSYEFGKSQDKRSVWKMVLITITSSFVSGIPMFILVYVFSDYIGVIFPNYQEVIPYLKIASFSLLFIGYKSGGLSFSVLKSWSIMFINIIVYFVVTSAAIFIMQLYTNDVLAVASYSLVIGYAFMSIFSLLLSYRVTHYTS
jgi:O-antigen/teichoic acid export membrane protein